MLEIFLQPEVQLVRTDQIDLSGYFAYLWILAFVFFIVVGVVVSRFFLRRIVAVRHATFQSHTILVTLPKFRHEEDSQRGPQKEQVQEAISAAESIFASIGGLRADRGISAWFFGRNDEIAFELLVEHKAIKFYVTLPRHMQTYIEQQISAAYPDAHLEVMEDFNLFTPTGIIVGSYLTFTRPYAFPIKTYRKMDSDPLNSLTNVLSKVPEGEAAAFQFVVRSSYKSWRHYGVDLATRMQQGVSLEDAIRGKKKHKKSFMDQLGLSSSQPKEQEPDYRLSPQEEEPEGFDSLTPAKYCSLLQSKLQLAQSSPWSQTLFPQLPRFAQYHCKAKLFGRALRLFPCLSADTAKYPGHIGLRCICRFLCRAFVALIFFP